ARAVDKASVASAAVVGFKASGLPTVSTDAFSAVAGGNQVAMSEIMLGDAMQQSYLLGGSPDMLVVPPSIKRTVSAFHGRDSTQVMVGKTEVVATVDVIATDFGRIKVLPSRWLASDVALLLDP